jgi:hypothetical protein
MDQPEPTSWYVSRQVDLPLGHAAAALDDLVDQRRRGVDSNSPVQLTASLRALPTSSLPGTARQLRGRLRLPRSRRPVRVELELAPWSTSRSDLGLRCARPPAGRSSRYWETAAATLEQLTEELVVVSGPSLAPALRRAS